MKTILLKNRRGIASAAILLTTLASALDAGAELAAINKVPFISTVSLERTVTTGTAPKFKFYVTDFENKDYMKNDTSESFVVNMYLSGSTVPFHTGTYGAGEHEVTLPTMSVAADEVRLAVQATDSQGRKSDMLFQRFRVANAADLVISGSQTFSPTAPYLLSTFGIYNDGTNPTSTTTGLNALLQASGSNGYRKVVLPGGTYLIKSGTTVNETVRIPTRMTLDLGGSTLKLEPNSLDKQVTVEIAHAYDSHVINGTIEGDLDTRGYTGAAGEGALGQWVTAVRLAQGAEYCSFENLTLRKYAGDGADTGSDFVGRVGPYNISHNNQIRAGTFSLGEFDETTGLRVSSTDRSATTTRVDISAFMSSYGFIQLGKYGGYQGNPVDNWTYRASFYDAAENYIGSTIGYLYRRMYPPPTAKWVQFTLFCPNVVTDINAFWIFNIRTPYNCDFKDLVLEDIRCVGMVPSGFNNLRVSGCTWNNCGWAAGRSAFDSEDGWDCSQDLVFQNNTFLTNPGAEFNGISGHNFILENNTMGLSKGARLASPLIRNNTLKTATLYFGAFDRSAYPRISNNTIQGMTMLGSTVSVGDAAEPEVDREYLIRDNVLQGGIYTTGTSRTIQRMMYSWSCTFTAGNIQGRAVNSALANVNTTSTQGGVLGRWCELDGCVVTSSTIKVGGFGNVSIIKNSTITNTAINTAGSTLFVISNTITNSPFTTASGNVVEDIHFEGNTISTSGTNVLKVAKGFSSVGFYNNTVNASNPNCRALWLYANSGTFTGTYTMAASVCGNTFTGSSTASAVYIQGTGTNITFPLGLKDNVCNTMTLTSGSMAGVTLVNPPSVSLTAPTAGSAGSAPASITFDATASDSDGTISKVEFYDGENFLGDDTSAPYSLSLNGFKAGSYSFTARAIDNGNNRNVSPRAVVTVSP